MSIPNSLKLINAAEVSSAVVSRRNTTIYPTGGQSVPVLSGGNVIEFKIPVSNNESVDMSTFFMHFNFNIVKQNNGDLAYVQDSIESIFDEVTVYIGNTGQEIERIRGYNRLESGLNYFINNGFVRSIGSSMMGCGLTRDERIKLYNNLTVTSGVTTIGASKTCQFSVPLRLCGVANPSFIMPSQIFGQSNFLIIRIRMATPSACLVAPAQSAVAIDASGVLTGGDYSASSNTVSYNLENVRCSFDFIQTSQDYQTQINQYLASSNLIYPVKTWDVDFRTVSGSIAENLSYNYRDIEAIFFWFNLDTELNNRLFAGEDRLRVPINISSIQLTVNGSKVPSVPIDLTNGASEALTHTLIALGSLHNAEEMGPFNFAPIFTNAAGYTGASNNSAYFEISGNQYYGREYLGEYDNSATAADRSYNRRLIGVNTLGNNANTAVLNPYLNDNTPSYFLIGLNMRKLLDLPQGELSGMNLQNTSGSVGYEIKFSANPGVTYSMGVAVLHNRFISLSGSGATVDI